MNIKTISEGLKTAGFELFEPNGVGINWNPTVDNLTECYQFGKDFAGFL
jgi:flavorubredoxin